MIDAAAHHSIEPTVLAFGLAITRVSSFVVASPMLGRGTAPNSVKVGLCVSLAMFWLPTYIARIAPGINPTMPAYVLSVLSEFAIGITLGFLVRLAMLPARIAGSYLGQELGFNLGQVTDPTSGAPTNETGLLFDAFGLVIFWISDIHHVALRMLGMSFAEMDGIDLVLNFAPTAANIIGDAHEYGILIIAPLASVLFLTLVYLMVIMRAWPQVTLFSFGMGLRLLVGLGAFLSLMPLIISSIEQVLIAFAHTISELFQSIA